MRYLFITAAAAAILAMASPAAATVFITSGPGAVQPDENVLFNNGPTAGLTIEGITNQTNTLVSITGGETLVAAGGQARLDTMDGTIDSPFTFNTFTNQLLGFDLSDSNLAFTQTEFRLFGGTATLATLTFVDTVRRQNFWDRRGADLAESWPHLGLIFRRRFCGVASADVGWSVV